MVAKVGLAPTTPRFSVECSTYLSYKAMLNVELWRGGQESNLHISHLQGRSRLVNRHPNDDFVYGGMYGI